MFPLMAFSSSTFLSWVLIKNIYERTQRKVKEEEAMRETPDTPPANATAQAMPGEFPWDPVPGVPQSTWISLEAESVDWKGIQL